MNSLLLVCSHHGVGTVVPIFWAARALIFIRIKLPNRSSGSKNRHDGHANLESSPRDFRADFGLRQLRRTDLARRINCWTQASSVLYIERAQGCRDRRPDADDAFFYAWSKHRDPKFTAKN
jgi:hypothetical protein